MTQSNLLRRSQERSTAGGTVEHHSGQLSAELAHILGMATRPQVGGPHTRLEATYFWLRTTVGEDPLAARLHSTQHRLRQGPAVDILTGSILYLSHDLANEVRWSKLARAATEIGVRSLLICRLQPASGCDVTLTSCSPAVHAFGHAEAAEAWALASRAASVLASAWSLPAEA